MPHHPRHPKETTKPETSNNDSRKADDNEHDEEDAEEQPVRTNLVHQLSIQAVDDAIDGQGHDLDEQATKVEHRRRRFLVHHLKELFETKLGAKHIDYGVSAAAIVQKCCSERPADDDDPFYIVNLSHYARQYQQWMHFLGRIQPFYAVKSNPSSFIIDVLAELGGGFDCASAEELDLVRKTCGKDFDCAKRIIYAHPCKPISHIKQFRDAGVQLTVVDNEDELTKLKAHWPEARVSDQRSFSQANVALI